MEWTQAVGVASTAIVGVQGVLKLYQRVKVMLRAPAPRGVTIMNGEYRTLIDAIGRIEGRQDRQGKLLEHVSQRVSNLEQRLSMQ